MPAPSLPSTFTRKRRAPGVGESVLRPDAPAKTQGRFAFSSDLWMDGMLWGKTLRSPFPHARITHLDTSPALLVPGVHAVITNDDLWGSRTYGLEHHDQPVFANEVALFHGEPIAAVAADHPEIAARAVAAIKVEYDVLEPLSDPEAALRPETRAIHPDGNVFRHIRLRHGDPSAVGDVVVEGSYEVGTQDQAFLGPESGLAVPSEDGGVELFIATQWLHVDRDQIAACLNLPRDKVRLTLSGTGGAFGGREDLSMQIHACLLALVTKKPIKMVYSREESFFGHVHRHPARLWYRHHADRDGNLVNVECRMVFDGGAYASSSTAVISNATSFAAGPYLVHNAAVDGYAVRTNNPPCGAMRGFGAVQTSFAAEAQMDKLADALGMDPIELRLRNALKTHDMLLTGQVIIGTAPVAECITACRDLPMPGPLADDAPIMTLPGGAGRTALHHNVRRGVGFAVGFKNLAFSEGFDDYATARVRLELGPTGEPLATVHTATAEVGQGFVTIAQQIARAELGVTDVIVHAADTQVGSAGSTSASRQTMMSGGAVQMACSAVREVILERAALELHLAPADMVLEEGELVTKDGTRSVSLVEALEAGPVEANREFHHPPTEPLDEHGQGNAHWSLAFAAHRAVVDVDVELGLVKVVQVATAQDIGKALNPLAVTGQIEGGIAQGVGLAVMEEIVVDGSRIRNPSFTDYLLPTPLDMPPVEQTWIEQPERGAPYGAKGVGEPPTISSTGAVLAAIRQATGLPLNRIPIRPDDIALAREQASTG
ncbi:MAG: xanthine dehydrogenase subunit D [Jiangellaceae bacterium]